MGIAGRLDHVPLEDLEELFTIVIKAQPSLAIAHVKPFAHMLSLLNQGLREHRQNRNMQTRNSLLRGISLWYILPALLHSQDGRVNRRGGSRLSRAVISLFFSRG